MNKKKLPLAFWIFIGLVVGIAVGLALMMVPNGLDIAKNYILPWGTIFLNLLKFIVVPIVLFSIASGVIWYGRRPRRAGADAQPAPCGDGRLRQQ